MSRLTVQDPIYGTLHDIDLPTLVSLIPGTSIVDVADSDWSINLDLSENLKVNIGNYGETVKVIVSSTLTPGEIAPARIQLINDDEEPAAIVVERRLRSLRQVYAIILALDTGRRNKLASMLLEDPDIDVEQALLKEEEYLYLQSAGPGSWWISALTKMKGAPQTALNCLSLIYGEGRQMLLERVRAGTEIKIQDVERERDRRIIELSKALDKVKNPYGKSAIQQRLISEMTSTNPKLARSATVGLLPRPDT